ISSLTDAELLAMFSVSPADPALLVNSGSTSGSLGWSFNSGSQAFNQLASGEQLTLTYTTRVTDSSGATADQDVTLTINGSNDTPTITATDVSGAVTEDVTSGSPARLRDSGSIAFSDLDLSDRHTATAAYINATASSGASVSNALNTALQDLANTFTLSGAGVGSLSSANSGTVKNDTAVDVDGGIYTLSTYAKIGESLGNSHYLHDGEPTRLGKDPLFQSQHVLTPTRGVALLINASHHRRPPPCRFLRFRYLRWRSRNTHRGWLVTPSKPRQAGQHVVRR
ncbi:MAG: hypothetical protein EBU30_09080, partial [Synechococcaceae bacterium WB6_3B_236]|nr:hypothetical protein [Synechococcaceae bacterium WB6_3B_236]